MLKYGWPILVPAAFAAAVVGTKLANFDIPQGLKINSALAGVADKDAAKIEAPKAVADPNYGLQPYKPLEPAQP